MNHEVKDIAKNVIHGIYNLIPHILKDAHVKHNNVRQISIKTASSISLPIFNQLTDEEINSYVGENDGTSTKASGSRKSSRASTKMQIEGEDELSDDAE